MRGGASEELAAGKETCWRPLRVTGCQLGGIPRWVQRVANSTSRLM